MALNHVRIIGVAGGSCSGKTTLVNILKALLGDDHCAIIRQDNYYRCQKNSPLSYDQINFDHPDIIEFDKLYEDLASLAKAQAIEMPVYDFATHSRLSTPRIVKPKTIILVEGTLIFTQEKLVSLFDRAIFIECDENTRRERRLVRDVSERARSAESVLAQIANTVEPMYNMFVSPSKSHAHKILNQEECLREMDPESSQLFTYCQAFIEQCTQSYSLTQHPIK